MGASGRFLDATGDCDGDEDVSISEFISDTSVKVFTINSDIKCQMPYWVLGVWLVDTRHIDHD
jgi:hypothetical protein